MNARTVGVIVAALASLMAAENGVAAGKEMVDTSKREFMNNCAVCHGQSGKGDGKMAEVLKVAPSDLTVLSEKNGGIFPYDRVYAVIDGREAVKGHGDRNMPIWGKAFIDKMAESSEYYFYGTDDVEVYTRARILRLIDYLSRIQTTNK
jgi:mono/diheme cytochrome c family protein